jgi:hypothetical protein
LILVVLLSRTAFACGIASGHPETADDYVTAEQAVIIWDESRKIEHFIREADIHTNSSDIGFLVPTPNTPEIVEVNASIFALASEVAHPQLVREIVYRTPLVIFWPLLRGPLVLAAPFYATLGGLSNMSEEDRYRIVTQEDVAGYHAVTLDVASPEALTNWMKQNGYVTTPELTAWLKPYIDARWKVTAFKLLKGESTSPTVRNAPIQTRAIRMSFAAERPFFPYSEPGDKAQAQAASPYGRTLCVAVLSSSRMQGNLADGTRWPADLLYAGLPIPAKTSRWNASEWLLLAKLDGQMQLPSTLTYWRDRSNPRPGTADLEFSASQDQSSYRKVETDYSLTTLHLIDPTHPLADLGGLMIAIFLPGAPAYCAWRFLRRQHLPVAADQRNNWRSKMRIIGDKVFGFVAITLGGFYVVCCFIIAYLYQNVADALPGYPLPVFAKPSVCYFVAALFCAQLICGARVLELGKALGEGTAPKARWARFWDWLIAGATSLIAIVFALAVVVTFIDSFLE